MELTGLKLGSCEVKGLPRQVCTREVRTREICAREIASGKKMTMKKETIYFIRSKRENNLIMRVYLIDWVIK